MGSLFIHACSGTHKVFMGFTQANAMKFNSQVFHAYVAMLYM